MFIGNSREDEYREVNYTQYGLQDIATLTVDQIMFNVMQDLNTYMAVPSIDSQQLKTQDTGIVKRIENCEEKPIPSVIDSSDEHITVCKQNEKTDTTDGKEKPTFDFPTVSSTLEKSKNFIDCISKCNILNLNFRNRKRI